MNKLSIIAAIATLSLAAPALAQTPSDIRNGRSTVPAPSSSEVKLDRHDSKAAPVDTTGTKDTMTEHHGKKHHGHKHHGHKHHHGKKHHHKAETAKKDEGKKEEGTK